MGGIELIVGEMFSGKTTEMFRRIERAKHAGQDTVIYKYSNDIRNGNDKASLASSHDGLHKPAIPVKTLKDVKIERNMVIGIDEGQFIGHLVEFAESAANQGCRVIISALLSDFKRNGFENIVKIFPKCEQITRLNAICFHCKKEAGFTQRIGSAEEIEIIGGASMYSAVCRSCYSEN